MATAAAPIYPGGRGWQMAGWAAARWNVASGLYCGWAAGGLEFVAGRFLSPPNIGPCSG
jgi:hypothetical protein